MRRPNSKKDMIIIIFLSVVWHAHLLGFDEGDAKSNGVEALYSI